MKYFCQMKNGFDEERKLKMLGAPSGLRCKSLKVRLNKLQLGLERQGVEYPEGSDEVERERGLTALAFSF